LAPEFSRLRFDKVISMSAAHGRGMSELVDSIVKLLPAVCGQDSESFREQGGRPAITSIHDSLPLAVAVIGRPNAGKSSLINSIVQSERAIVSELPGTTRDAVDILYQRGTSHFIFIDTAGMRRRGRHSTSAEVFSVMRAERSIRRADLCLLLVDLQTGVTAQDNRIAGLIQKARKASVVVLNKWDL